MRSFIVILIVIMAALATTGCGYTPRQHAAIWMGAIGQAAHAHNEQQTAPPRPHPIRCTYYPASNITECR